MEVRATLLRTTTLCVSTRNLSDIRFYLNHSSTNTDRSRVCVRAGFKLASAAELGAPWGTWVWLVDAIHVRVNTLSPGAGAVGLIYNSTAAGDPAELLVATPVTAVPAGLDGWLKLPLAVGWLLEKNQDCFETASGDTYSTNAWPTPSADWGPVSSGPIGIDVSVIPPVVE